MSYRLTHHDLVDEISGEVQSITVGLMSAVLISKVIKSNLQLMIILVLIYCFVCFFLWVIEVLRGKRKADKAEGRNSPH